MIVIHFLVMIESKALQRVAELNQSFDQFLDWTHHQIKQALWHVQIWIDLLTDLLTELIIEWTEHVLLNMINMNRISFIKCDKHEQRKLY